MVVFPWYRQNPNLVLVYPLPASRRQVNATGKAENRVSKRVGGKNTKNENDQTYDSNCINQLHANDCQGTERC